MTPITPHLGSNNSRVMYGAGSDHQIFTEQERQDHQTYLSVYNSREALIDHIAQRVSGDGSYDENGQPVWGMPLSQSDLDYLYAHLGGRFFVFFTWIGNASTILIGGCFFFTIINTTFQFLMRLYGLIRERGCGVWIICTCASFLFLVAGLPIRTVRRIHDTAGDMQQALQDQDETMHTLGYRGRRRRRRHDEDDYSESNDDDERGHGRHRHQRQRRPSVSSWHSRSLSPATDVTFIPPPVRDQPFHHSSGARPKDVPKGKVPKRKGGSIFRRRRNQENRDVEIDIGQAMPLMPLSGSPVPVIHPRQDHSGHQEERNRYK